ncbi:alkaline shock response membrane anchor protein AmaP [Streptomyces sp. NPDC012888]|uniref:alkaline shock response membrane anchor protein AmaP n=1 Tax=Streptomyces sp. NPDC012888 TaxID=3364855 RepID=UPI0036C13996
MSRKSAVNRSLLALTGLVALGTGLLVLAGGFDVYRRWRLAPGAGMPWDAPRDVLLGTADRTRWSGEWWWWPAVIAVLALIVLLALWWLLAQLRRTHPGRVPVGSPPDVDGAVLREGALGEALESDAGRQRGVQGAKARMDGSSRHPEAHLDLTLAPGGAPGPVLQDLSEGPLQRLRDSTGHPDLPATARLRVASHKPQRAE